MQSSLGATAKGISISLIRTAVVAAKVVYRTIAVPAAGSGAAAVAAVIDIKEIPILLIRTTSCSSTTDTTRLNQSPYKVMHLMYVKVIIAYNIASNVSLQCLLECIRVWHTLKTKENKTFKWYKNVYEKFNELTESVGVHILT